jgi:hypothetical protein
MDAEGIRQSLMAKELSDLPAESLAFALDAWKRGDKRHLSSYQQDVARIGVFFPKPAELREIAELHAANKRDRDRAENMRLTRKAEERDREAHPERYTTMAAVYADVAHRGRVKLLEAPQPAESKKAYCEHCNGVQLSALRAEDLRALADVLDRRAKS